MPTCETLETDVLVIGGGGAGCRAAIEVNRRGMKVIIVNKGELGKSGCTPLAAQMSAVGPWSKPKDSVEKHFEDMVRGGYYQCNQKLAEILCKYAGPQFLEILEWGGMVYRNPDGSIFLYQTEGHSIPRTFYFEGRLGMITMKTLKGEILKHNIDFYNETMATNLLLNNGHVVGAAALSLPEGKFIVFKAKATVLATGGASQVYPYTIVPADETGDGIAMAYRAGAELVDMEHVCFMAATYWYPQTWRGKWLACQPTISGTSYAREKMGEEVPSPQWLNIKGERFMKRYDPEKMEGTVKDLAARAIAMEAQERGTEQGGIYVDWRPVGDFLDEIRKANVTADASFRIADQAGIDPKKQLIEAHAIVHTTTGGIRINEFCETNIPGLYAAGGIVGGVHGASRIGGSGLSWALVFGWRAGVYAAEYAKKTEWPTIRWEDVEKEHNRIYSFLSRPVKNGLHTAKILKKLREEMWVNVGVLRNEKGLKSALKKISAMQKKLGQICISSYSRFYNPEWIDAITLENLLQVAEAITRSALVRTESRGSHFRKDYPKMDNVNWLKNIVVRRKSGKMKLYTIPFVMTKLKPDL